MLCSWVIARSLNTHSMDYTTQNKNSPKFLDDPLHNFSYLKISYQCRKMVDLSVAHNGKEWQNMTTGIYWKVMVCDWKHI